MSKFEKSHWNPIDALSWIMYRDESLILGNLSRTDLSDQMVNFDIRLAKVDDRVKGNKKEEKLLAGLKNAREKEQLIKLSVAEELLKNELTKGTIKAIGSKSGKGLPTQIPATHWTKLNIRTDPPTPPWAEYRQSSEIIFWADIQIEKDSLISIWGDEPKDNNVDSWKSRSLQLSKEIYGKYPGKIKNSLAENIKKILDDEEYVNRNKKPVSLDSILKDGIDKSLTFKKFGTHRIS